MRAMTCPDGGTCHHECVAYSEGGDGCFRVARCGPLTGVYPDDRWPDEVRDDHGHPPLPPSWTWAPDRAETLEQAVLQAVGAASMCWVGGTGDMVLDSTSAAAVGVGLAAWIEEFMNTDVVVVSRENHGLAYDLASVLNRHSAENGSDTPDFILADLLDAVLKAFDVAVMARGRWFNHHCSIGDCDHRDWQSSPDMSSPESPKNPHPHPQEDM